MADTYVDIMLQSLEKKENILDEIIRLNIKQRDGLEDPELTPEEFDETVEAKAELIEQLEQLDSGFEKLFQRVKDELEKDKAKYGEKIKSMQGHIKSITDKSIDIQTQEARNKDLMTKKFAIIKQQVKQVRTRQMHQTILANSPRCSRVAHAKGSASISRISAVENSLQHFVSLRRARPSSMVSATVTSASCSTIWTIMMYGISSRCSSVRLSRMACSMSGMWRCSDDPHKTRRIL